jgi:hypothetical protein
LLEKLENASVLIENTKKEVILSRNPAKVPNKLFMFDDQQNDILEGNENNTDK